MAKAYLVSMLHKLCTTAYKLMSLHTCKMLSAKMPKKNKNKNKQKQKQQFQ